MNLLLLLAGVRVWSGTPVEWITRVFLAVSLLSFEMQLATWTGLATLWTLVPLNAVLAAALFVWHGRKPQAAGEVLGLMRQAWPPLAVLMLAVVMLNLATPLGTADPYHLQRAERIGLVGTLAYDPLVHPKSNVLGWLYELLLADVAAIPVLGGSMLRLHGAVGLVFFTLTIGAVMHLLGRSSRLGWCLLLTVPAVFHQFVLVKNDLFGAMPALVVLAWLVTRVSVAPPIEIAWAMWLTGIAFGMKLTSFPLALVAGAAIVVAHARDGKRMGAAAIGGLVGLMAGGLLFTLVENVRVYGSIVEPIRGLGNRTAGVAEAVTSVVRYLVSLFDLGTLTRRWWPGRGGWGATYGLPFVWAMGVLFYARRQPDVRRTLWLAAAYGIAFAAVYPDADVAHRLVLAPGLLVIAVATVVTQRESSVPAWMQPAGFAVAALSGVQVARSVVLYWVRA
jgi:hypothetical protein